MFTVIMILILLIGAVMTVAILMQSSKGQGLSGAFGGAGGVGSMLGVRRAGDVLSNATWILAASFIVLIFVVNLFFLPTQATQDSIILKGMQEKPMNAAQQPAQQQQAPPPAGQQPQGQPPAGQAPAGQPAPAPAPAPGK
jgi:preprotein translocase subunit SecG